MTLRPRLQAFVIAFAIAFTASLFDFVLVGLINQVDYRLQDSMNPTYGQLDTRTIRDVAFLGFGIVLVATSPTRSGITLGTKQHRTKAVAICVLVIGSVLAYRYLLDGDAFDTWNTRWSIWAISPIAQELVFSGFILGLLVVHFPQWWHKSIPISWAVVMSALLFGMWHFIPDFIFEGRELDYILFRLAYTAGGWTLYAMTRLWTGTIIYAAIMHTAVNFIILGY